MRKLETPWDFVERYYPKYTSSTEIAENNDLSVIVDGEVEAGSCAAEAFEAIKSYIASEHPGLEDKEEIEAEAKALAELRLMWSNAEVYERAIEGFIEGVDNWT